MKQRALCRSKNTHIYTHIHVHKNTLALERDTSQKVKYISTTGLKLRAKAKRYYLLFRTEKKLTGKTFFPLRECMLPSSPFFPFFA